MHSNRFSTEGIITLIGLLVGLGVTWGTLSSRVTALEQRPDQSVNVATLSQKIDDVSGQVSEMSGDVKHLLIAVGRLANKR